jgi:hypothetical protein
VAARKRSPAPATELELRVELAERRAERDQRMARSLCAVSSELCRAGDEWEWFDLTRGRSTFCFCPGHALAAELCCVGDGDIYPSMSPEQFLSAVARAEARAHNERRHQEVNGV